MATKRMERTVIEGGRTGYSKYERRTSHARVRVRVKAQLRAWRDDPEQSEDASPRRRLDAYKGFADKLGPAERWLFAHRGRPWDDVYARMVATFDTRTLAGRHIVFEHLLPGWGETLHDGWTVAGRWWFSVDDTGTLRAGPRTWERRPIDRRVRPDVEAWVGLRKVGRRGAVLFWLEPTLAWSPLVHERTQQRQYWRQGRRLDEADTAYVAGFNAREQERFVVDL